MKKKLPALLPVAVFLTMVFGFSLWNLLRPARSFSENENRALAQLPQFSLESLFAGTFTSDYEEYLTDQFPLRDEWISLKTRAELLLGKKDVNNVYFGKNGWLLDKYKGTLSEERMQDNLAKLGEFTHYAAGLLGEDHVRAMLVPTASGVLTNRLPPFASDFDQAAMLAQAEALCPEGTFLSLLPALQEHQEEYIYYRTDHHWTTLGAYYAYDQLCQTLGLVPFDRSAHTAVEVENFYGTFYSRARTWNAKPDVLTYYQLDAPLTIYQVTGPGMPGEGQTTGLYDLAKLDAYDKYAAFLHGNNGLSRVEGEGQGRILVIKDSYANSLVPFLTANYADIDVIDLRNYNYGLDALIQENQYDQILVLYSFDSFKSDPYLYRAGIEG